jgi:enoyl-CoA hydratase/carnithine racemase
MVHETDHPDVDTVRVITLDRPNTRNAFDHQQYVDTAAALARAIDDDAVRVIVITGAGSAFSAGQDLKEMAALMSGELHIDGGQGFPALLEQLENCDKPLIAAVNGAAAGVGMTMLLHCDIVLVGSSARLRVPFSEMGVPPEAASSLLMPAVLGWQRAAELLFTSRWVHAEEAVTIGLALSSSSDENLMHDALDLARRIAAQQPAGLRAAKRLMLAARRDAVSAARVREEAAFAELFATTRTDPHAN